MKNKIFCYTKAGQTVVASSIITQTNQSPQAIRQLPSLTDIVEALEKFQNFEPAVRATAITLRASEVGVPQIHFYAIALHAGLGGEF